MINKLILISASALLVLSGCSSTPTQTSKHQQETSNPIVILTNTQSNLKVAEIPPTETSGKNYQYCYGCVVFNYKNFQPDDKTNSVASNLMSAISSQIVVQNGEFKTGINYLTNDPQVPQTTTQQTSLSVLQGDS